MQLYHTTCKVVFKSILFIYPKYKKALQSVQHITPSMILLLIQIEINSQKSPSTGKNKEISGTATVTDRHPINVLCTE